jgi:hypothetical protein
MNFFSVVLHSSVTLNEISENWYFFHIPYYWKNVPLEDGSVCAMEDLNAVYFVEKGPFTLLQ